MPAHYIECPICKKPGGKPVCTDCIKRHFPDRKKRLEYLKALEAGLSDAKKPPGKAAS